MNYALESLRISEVTNEQLKKWALTMPRVCMQHDYSNLINQVAGDHSPGQLIINEYGHAFDGLGCLKDECHIEVHFAVRPVQHAPRRVSVSLEEKLKERLMSWRGERS